MKKRRRISEKAKLYSNAVLCWIADDFEKLSKKDILELTLDIAPNNLIEEQRIWDELKAERTFESREDFLKRKLGFIS